LGDDLGTSDARDDVIRYHGAGAKVVDDDASLLIALEDVVVDRGHARGSLKLTAYDDADSVLAAAKWRVVDISDEVVRDSRRGSAVDADAGPNGIATGVSWPADDQVVDDDVHERCASDSNDGFGVEHCRRRLDRR